MAWRTAPEDSWPDATGRNSPNDLSDGISGNCERSNPIRNRCVGGTVALDSAQGEKSRARRDYSNVRKSGQYRDREFPGVEFSLFRSGQTVLPGRSTSRN